MKERVNGNGTHPDTHPDHHPNRDSIVAYAAGVCSPEDKGAIEEHWLGCETCRAQLSTILRLIASPEGDLEQVEMEALLPLGQRAAAQARKLVRQQEGWDNKEVIVRRKIHAIRPYLAPTLIILALLGGGGLLTYKIFRGQSSDERLLARAREIYRDSRHTQARVTGGFAYQPYVVTRGSNDFKVNDEAQRVALISELSLAAGSGRKPDANHTLGRLFLLQGDLKAALDQFQLALKEQPRDANLLADLGALFYERSLKEGEEDHASIENAVEYLSTAIDINPKLPEALFNRALCYERLNLVGQSERDWSEYLTLDRDSAWAEEAREHLKNLRERVDKLGKMEKTAQNEFLAAEAAGDEGKMREIVGVNFVPIQNLALDRIFDEYLSASIAGERSQAEQHLRSLEHIGRLICEVKRDRFVQDMVDFASRRPIPVKREIQSVHQMLRQARQEDARGKTGAAVELFAKARAAAERIDDVPHMEMSYLGLVRGYRHKEESQGLAILRNKLIADSMRRSHQQIYAKALLALANAEGATQQLSRALKHSHQAVAVARELGDTETQVNSLRFVGGADDSIGNRGSALKWFFEASLIQRTAWVKPILAAVTYSAAADIHFRAQKYYVALPYQLEAARLCEQAGNPLILAYTIQKVGLIYGMMEHRDEAMRYLNNAVERVETLPDQTARLRLKIDLYTMTGDFYLQQKKIGEAIDTYHQAIDSIGGGNSQYHLSSIHQGLAKAYLANGQNREAEGELSKCITLMEEAREQISDANSRGAFLASQQSVYCAMVSFQFFNNKDPEQAFNYAEIAKGRDLLDALSGTGHVTASDGQVKLALSQSVTPLKFEQVQRALPPNAQLVQYAVGKDRLMIWHITRDRFSTATADIGADALRTKVMAYLDGLHGRGEIEDLNRKASELYQLLIAPIGDKLDRKLALCITPDGVIQDLPFAALVAPESKRYLIEDFALVTNTSASVFARTLDLSRSKPKGDLESFLGVGNPYFSPQRFSDLRPLPAAEQELDRIRSFYPKNQILTRKQATESAVMKQIGDYEIVHLATHALSDKESSMLSSIVLADESNPVPEDKKSDRIVFDGALHAHEILRLKPGRTRLVLLSSCSSGIGGGDRNEAMSGLAQSFLVAGVPTVVASLWDVDDESAAALMEKLHAAHRTNKMDFGQALRQAQLSYLQTAPLKKRHPFFWSTFIVTGNGLAN